MNENTVVTKVDVAFPLAGERLPLDHGYALFGALSRVLGNELHGAEWLAVHPIAGVPGRDGTLALKPHNLALRLRVNPAEIPKILPLAGASLELDGHALLVGTSRLFALEPSADLFARTVVIKQSFPKDQPAPEKAWENPAEFSAAVQRQLDAHGIKATIEVQRRRVLRIAGDIVVGFETALHGLSNEDSLRAQSVGLGGRQRFGCGVLRPARGRRLGGAS